MHACSKEFEKKKGESPKTSRVVALAATSVVVCAVMAGRAQTPRSIGAI
jgi:hypothetical protein